MNHFKKKYLLLSIILFHITNLYPQVDKEVVAKAGHLVISKEEFFKRYEFTPHVRNNDAFDSTTFKRDFLYTLIAEKLLAQAASKEGIEKSPGFYTAMNYLRNIYLRDALYNVEVKSKIVLPDSELAKGRARILKTLHVKFIFSQDKPEIDRLYSALINGASFDSILATRKENNEQPQSESVTFGTMNQKIEEAIYKLLPGQITGPIQLREGWYICKVYSVTSKSDAGLSDLSKVEKIVSSRIEDKLYENFYKNFFKGIKINADRILFTKLSEVIFNYLKNNQQNLGGTNKIRLNEKEFSEIKKLFSKQELAAVFVKFKKDPVSLEQFINYIAMEDFSIEISSGEFEKGEDAAVKIGLNTYVRNFIQNELLAREALKRGYDKLPVVEAQLKIWKDYYLSHGMMKKIFKDQPVSDDEALQFFIKANKIVQHPDEVKIAEILTNNLEVIQFILEELDKGADFKQLAAKYTMRDSLKGRSGEFNFFPVSENGELGKAASQMKIGEIYGPIKLPEGFSIIKLLDKREGKKIKMDSFEEARDDIKNILRTEKMYKRLDEITAKLAADYGMQINETVLKSLKVSSVDMLVMRRFGFGGQMMAVPYAPSFSSWFKVYERMKKSNLP